MILGVDGLRLLGRRAGVGRVLEALLRQLGRLEHPFRELRVYTPRPLPREAEPAPWEGPRIRNTVVPGPSSPGLWQQLALPRAHGRAGLLLCPSYTVPLLARSPTLLIHHGSYEGCPEAFPFGRRLRARILHTSSAWRATSVVTVSEHSRREMVRFYRLPAERIRVIPNGVDTDLFRPLDADAVRRWRRTTFCDERPFVLYVGNDNPRRRLPELTEAFAEIRRRLGLPHRLVFAGFELAGTVAEATAERCGVGCEVRALGHLEPERLALAYNAADLLAYPSVYEGFGLPVLEAMACGTPAIAVDRTAFPEFAGGVALLLPDARVETLADGMASVLTDGARRRRMARDGVRRAAAYGWPEIARRYLEVMVEVARGDGGPR